MRNFRKLHRVWFSIAFTISLTLLHSALASPVKAQIIDMGDAPEGVTAYPSSGIIGQFPTCLQAGPPGSFIQHTNFGAYFGPTIDPIDPDGNAGGCRSGFIPYDQDECFNDGDAGLMFPQPFTIQGNTVVPCPGSTGASLGDACSPGIWGRNVDIQVHNTMPNHEPYLPGYVNVLVDWNQDGQWGGTANCPGGAAPEHILVNFQVPPLYIGPLSALAPPSFLLGPNSGHVWVRFSITETPVLLPWDGSGGFEDGETEDYLFYVAAPEALSPVPAFNAWGVIVLSLILAASALWFVRRRIRSL